VRRWIIAAAIAGAGVLWGATLGYAFHGEKVYVANHACRGHAVRPPGVTLACGDGNLYATGITYKTYGQKVATATATMHLNDCVPYCARGRFHSYSGTLSFRDIVRCADGRLYYSRLRYRFAGPFGSGTANIAPLKRCSGILG
jgi:hypothetical protein